MRPPTITCDKPEVSQTVSYLAEEIDFLAALDALAIRYHNGPLQTSSTMPCGFILDPILQVISADECHAKGIRVLHMLAKPVSLTPATLHKLNVQSISMAL